MRIEKIKVRINVNVINDLPSTDDEVVSFIEENVCSHCREVAKKRRMYEYYKQTKCKEGSICAAASMLQAMLRYELIHHSGNNVADLIRKIIDLENVNV
jgi:hypothetical protein